MERLIEPEELRLELLERGIKDEGCHHRLSNGGHGEKLDLKKIEGTPTYGKVVYAKVQKIQSFVARHSRLVIVGIAEGTNQTALDIADEIGGLAIGVQTVKQKDGRSVKLNQVAKRTIEAYEPHIIVTDEDVSSTGSVVASVVGEVQKLGFHKIINVPTWQRQARLPYLEALKVPSNPIILHEEPIYTPEECHEKYFCANGVPLIPHGAIA